MNYLYRYEAILNENLAYSFHEMFDYLESLNYQKIQSNQVIRFFVFDAFLNSYSKKSIQFLLKSNISNKEYPIREDFKTIWDFYRWNSETSLQYVEALTVNLFFTFYVHRDNPNDFSIKDLKDEINNGMNRFILLNDEIDESFQIINYELDNLSSTRTKSFRIKFNLVLENYFEIKPFQTSKKDFE